MPNKFLPRSDILYHPMETFIKDMQKQNYE